MLLAGLGAAQATGCGEAPQPDWTQLGAARRAPWREALSAPGHQAAVAIVAHPDDDLLFMSTFLRHALRLGRPLRVIYLTSGDAGRARAYWERREAGVRAAYAAWLAEPPRWRCQLAPTPHGAHVEWTARVAGAPLSLVFLRLPDGNARGRGFRRTHRQSLRRLYRGDQRVLASVDGSYHFTRAALVQTLRALEEGWADETGLPVALALQDCAAAGGRPPDHADHRYGALFALAGHAAGTAYGPGEALLLHWGYGAAAEAENLGPEQRRHKWAAFRRYTAFDAQSLAPQRRHLGQRPLALYERLRDREYAWYVRAGDVSAGPNGCALMDPTLLE